MTANRLKRGRGASGSNREKVGYKGVRTPMPDSLRVEVVQDRDTAVRCENSLLGSSGAHLCIEKQIMR